MAEFGYTDLLPSGGTEPQYRLLTRDGVSTFEGSTSLRRRSTARTRAISSRIENGFVT